MIAGVRGVLIAVEEGAVVVDLHGFMLRLLAPGSTLNALPSPGQHVELRTHLVVREDSLTLYGFATDAELQLFQLMLGVTGVGPRAALGLLSFAEPGEIYQAISNEDTALLARAPGIGKVTAGRIVLDLRRKLPEDLGIATAAPDDRDREAVEALLALGYDVAEARAAVTGIESRDGLTVEERVVAALRGLDRG